MRARRAGRRAERLASAAMWLRGYRVVGRNVRVAGREVDLVARRGGTLVVCEVKARRTGARGSAVAAVSPTQRRRLRQAAEVLLARDPSAARVRLDLIAVDGWRVRVLRDAL